MWCWSNCCCRFTNISDVIELFRLQWNTQSTLIPQKLQFAKKNQHLLTFQDLWQICWCLSSNLHLMFFPPGLLHTWLDHLLQLWNQAVWSDYHLLWLVPWDLLLTQQFLALLQCDYHLLDQYCTPLHWQKYNRMDKAYGEWPCPNAACCSDTSSPFSSSHLGSFYFSAMCMSSIPVYLPLYMLTKLQ